MISDSKTTILQPVNNYHSKQYPNLRRMTNALMSGKHRVTCSFTPVAARQIEDAPEILLHHELYDRLDGTVFVYNRQGQPYCAVRTRFEQGKGEVVEGYALNELPEAATNKCVDLLADYPDLFLPFDLYHLQNGTEKAMAKEAGMRDGYQSIEHDQAFNSSSDPFRTYKMLHYLTGQNGPLAERLKGIEKTLELGSGLGLTSLILSRFLSGARLHGVEIDQKLLEKAVKSKKHLRSRYGYDFSRVNFIQDDVMGLRRIRIEDYGLAIGWFPLFSGMSNEELAGILQRLKPGALFFQFMSDSPFSSPKMAGKHGFCDIEIESDDMLPYRVFERTA